MCNFELSPEAFAQRRLEMIALADERRLVRALRPVRAKAVRPRSARARLTSPLTSPVTGPLTIRVTRGRRFGPAPTG